MKGAYGKEAPLTISRGKVHKYLGMNIDYRQRGKVAITMYEFINELLSKLPVDMDGEANTPASSHLFNFNDDGTELDERQSIMFHHFIAKLLFLCKWARPDLQTAVAFLSTRVKAPDNDDYKKLRRAVQYLVATKELPLTIEQTIQIL